ncbi:hypothetical protein CRG98_026056 [Punica granatum]|uniref:Uncharacterized protein n=1 Tax=Punica granatum TaxID=22663 RepID=A0A2I0JB91_PUNGR|nr:hypothetical protein CRG98_026056 [Punica granatum]
MVTYPGLIGTSGVFSGHRHFFSIKKNFGYPDDHRRRFTNVVRWVDLTNKGLNEPNSFLAGTNTGRVIDRIDSDSVATGLGADSVMW